MEKLLTIIIPGYNVANFIVDTLREVFNQCESNFEVIYVDDASNDNTLMLIHQNFKNFIMEKRLSVIESEVNCGPATARQKALDKVQTPYVTFLDADDSYTSIHVVSALVRILKEEKPDLLMFKYITDHGKLKLKKKCILSSSLSAREAMIHKMKTANPIWDYLWNKCYKMSVIKNNKIKFEEGIRSAEDVEFNRQYLKITKTIKFIDEYFYIYNCTNASSVTKKKSSMSEDYLVQWWNRETTKYNVLLEDCASLSCEHVCQPYLAKDLAQTAVRLTNISHDLGGRILESVIKKDSLYPVFKRYIWKSRLNYFSNKVLTNLKQVIKNIYNGFNSKQSNQKY